MHISTHIMSQSYYISINMRKKLLKKMDTSLKENCGRITNYSDTVLIQLIPQIVSEVQNDVGLAHVKHSRCGVLVTILQVQLVARVI